ncbi:MAG: hypothetical protein QXU32_02115 [Nitrososphaerales archaeon]
MQKAMNGVPNVKVQIYTSEMCLDETLYCVESYIKDIVVLKPVCDECDGNGSCNKCNGRIKLHHTRIARIYDDNGNVIFDADGVRKEKQMSTEQKAEAVSIDDLKSQGELWSKDVNFDHASYKVEAHVLIAPDHRSFRVFNTYNGTLGKNGKLGDKTYTLEDDAAYERKIAKLKRQGYKKH